MYIDLITQILNAQAVNKENIKFPASKMDEAVLIILEKEKFIKSFEKKGKNIKKYFDIELSYNDGKGASIGKKFISKPSRRVYLKGSEIYKIRQGYGISIISTSKGLMTNTDARKNNIGGEILFEIW